MTDGIEIPVSFPGAGPASDEMGRLARTTEEMDRAQAQSARSAIAFGQRLAGVANSVQALVGQFGGGSHTAGLIGAIANSTVQFAQLGAALGPGGAMVGAIVGVAIPAIHEMSEAMHVAEVQAHETAASVADMVSAYESTREAAELQARLSDGTATLSERLDAATAAQARYTDAVAHQVDLERRLDDLQRQEQSRTSQILLGISAEEMQRRADVEATQREIEASHAHVAQLQAEAEQASTTAGSLQALADAAEDAAHRREAGNPHARSGGGGGPSADEVQGDAISEALARRHDAEALAIADAERAAEEQRKQIEDEIQLRHEQGEAAEFAAQKAMDAADRERAHDDEVMASRRAAYQDQLAAFQEMQAEQAATTEAITAQAQSAFGTIMSDMARVLAQMAEGNATAEEGAKLMLAAFLNYISQVAGIQALAEVARAISSYPDFGGIAAHIAGALAWGAVAVATGVGGAAVSADVSKAQQARHEAEKPAAPQSGGGGESKPNTYVVNFNQPVVTAQTHAQLGRELEGMLGASRARYGA